jgi:hypothetical protein
MVLNQNGYLVGKSGLLRKNPGNYKGIERMVSITIYFKLLRNTFYE